MARDDDTASSALGGRPVGTAQVRSLSRGLEILALFSEERPSLSLREITTTTGFPKTSILRYVQTLEGAGLLWVDRKGRYLLGPQLANWASLAAATWQPAPPLLDALEQLVARGEETVHVYVRRGVRRVCIARHEAPRPLRHVVGLGESLPLFAGGASKVLLSDAPAPLLEEVAASSPSGMAALSQLEADASAARDAGYATSDGELEPGLSSVAVPLTTTEGAVIAALSFGGPTVRFDEVRVARLLVELRAAAVRIHETWLPGISRGPWTASSASRADNGDPVQHS